MAGRPAEQTRPTANWICARQPPVVRRPSRAPSSAGTQAPSLAKSAAEPPPPLSADNLSNQLTNYANSAPADLGAAFKSLAWPDSSKRRAAAWEPRAPPSGPRADNLGERRTKFNYLRKRSPSPITSTKRAQTGPVPASGALAALDWVTYKRKCQIPAALSS